MARGDNNRKLTDEAKEFLLQQLAQFASHAQAADRLEREFSIKIDKSRVTRIAKEEGKRIKSYREAFLSSFDETPLAHTKLRVMELSRLYAGMERQPLKPGERINLQATLLEAIRQEMNPIQHALIVSTSAKEAEEFLASLGFGRSDPRPVPGKPRPEHPH